MVSCREGMPPPQCRSVEWPGSMHTIERTDLHRRGPRGSISPTPVAAAAVPPHPQPLPPRLQQPGRRSQRRTAPSAEASPRRAPPAAAEAAGARRAGRRRLLLWLPARLSSVPLAAPWLLAPRCSLLSAPLAFGNTAVGAVGERERLGKRGEDGSEAIETMGGFESKKGDRAELKLQRPC